MLEIKFDDQLKKYTVAPVIARESENYVIVCESEYEAKLLCTQIMMGMAPSISDNPQNYQSIGTHPDGKRQLYKLKQR